ncbi:MAG: type II toxin-antitoxin system RelB/DinJ family antitoxin [Mycoplasmataceae bacterium]|jgi:addiction module RelB/DinJ family antitoxin|nr:type II toxin-antitoxin system RelB/DinJ family antitoxin [Mycoplasmataceae bacterium]
MSQININIRANKQDKERFSIICESLGLNVSSAFNVFMKKVIIEKKIPFELTTQKTLSNLDDESKEWMLLTASSMKDWLDDKDEDKAWAFLQKAI